MAAARDLRATETADIGDVDAVELAKRHLIQPWPFAGSVGAEARALIGEGDGIYITDSTGKRLIDGPAGMWCVNVGHRREELAKVMYDQAMALSQHALVRERRQASTGACRRAGRSQPRLLHHRRLLGRQGKLRFSSSNDMRGRPEKLI